MCSGSGGSSELQVERETGGLDWVLVLVGDRWPSACSKAANVAQGDWPCCLMS